MRDEQTLSPATTKPSIPDAPGVIYPRRPFIRWLLRRLTGIALFALCRLRIEGGENLPARGPAILVINHFHYADPAVVLWLSRRQVEFVGGFRFLIGPKYLHFLPRLWGYIPAFRGGYSRQTLKSAVGVLDQGGLLAIFPEGGAWANVLRPARPGAAYIAGESGAPVIPVGLDGLDGLFNAWRPEVTVRIGEPIGPFRISGRGNARRREIDRIGRTMMRAIAALVPDERRGLFSRDPVLRREAEKVAAFPFERDGMRGI